MCRRFLLALLAAVVVLAGWPPQADHTAAAADPDYFTFDSASGTIYGYSSLGPLDVVIPDEIAGTPVKRIAANAFLDKGLTSVVLPDSLIEIGARAFKSNQLISVTLPDSLVLLGNGAFENNRLTSVTIPSHLQKIGETAFLGNELTSVVIPEGVQIIGDSSFAFNKLTSVHLPESVTKIDSNAFLGNEMTSVTLPSNLESIGPGAFKQNLITSITLPSSLKTIETEAFLKNKLAAITLPDGLETIGRSAFEENELTSVVLPDSLTSLGNSSFRFNRLTSATLPSTIEVIPEFTFADNQLTAVTLPESVKTIQKNAFYNNQLTAVELPAQIETIGDSAFSENALTEIVLPDSVTNVGGYAFSKNGITSITFPSAAVTLGSNVFGENAMTSVVIPAWMTNIPTGLFMNNQLTSVTFHDAVEQINGSAFRDNQLTAVDFPDSLEIVAARAFTENKLTSVTLPANVTSVGVLAFGSNALTTVTILGETTNIGSNVFAGNAITTVTINGSGVVVGTNAFGNNQLNAADLYIIAPGGSGAHTYATNNGHTFINSSLFTVNTATGEITGYADETGPANIAVPSVLSDVVVTGIGSHVFQNTINLQSVYLPDTITRLAAGAFSGSSVTEVRLPGGLAEIEAGTFAGSMLANITIPGSVKTIGDTAFYGAKLQQLELPEGVETIGAAAFAGNELGKLLLPFSLKAVHGGAFEHNGLTEVIVLNKETEVQSGVLDGNPPELIVYGHPGSDAQAYADGHQLAFKPLAELSQPEPYSFDNKVYKYAPVTPLTVTVAKWLPGTLDNLEVTLSGAHAHAFEASPPDATLLDDAAPETQFAVGPKTGLAAGIYNATVTLSADYGVSLSFDVSFRVKRPTDDDSGGTPADPGGGTPLAPDEGAPAVSEEDAPAAPGEGGVDILVNGSAESMGTAVTGEPNGRKVTTVTIAEDKLRQRLDREDAGAVISIPVAAGSDIVIGELNGRLVKHMGQRQAVLDIRTDQAAYTLPAQLIDMDAVSGRFGANLALEDIKLHIEIAVPTDETAAIVENAASAKGLTVVAPPLDFSIKAVYGERVEEIARFSAYVERTVAIPEGVDPSRITTGVVIEQDGAVRHVPTKIIVIGGQYYARINSLSNSTYAVVWNPLEFNDAAQHWASGAVNDMGSRMVIEGTGNGMFAPDRDISRAEFAAILVRGLGLRQESGAAPFSDVAGSDWYSGAVNTAYAYQLISGFEDGTFQPNSKITREQAMVALSKAMALTGLKDELSSLAADETLSPFGDAAAISAWARSSVADGVHAGIVSGRSADALAPQGHMTRAEVAVIMQKLLQKSGLI